MKKISRIRLCLFAVLGFFIILTNSCKKDELKAVYKIPVVVTSAVSEITKNTANCSGKIISDDSLTVTEYGICWSIVSNPTILLGNHTTATSNPANFKITLWSLNSNTTYYMRAYATNIAGTGYGNEISFTTDINFGDTFQGGLLAYYFQPGDTGYIPGELHGLIVAPFDQADYVKWYNGVYKTTGASGKELGTGNSNTKTIVDSQGVGNYAAKLCYDLVLRGYSDWYLPSIKELNKIYLNKDFLGFNINNMYWSSSEYSNNLAYTTNFGGGWWTGFEKREHTLFVQFGHFSNLSFIDWLEILSSCYLYFQ